MEDNFAIESTSAILLQTLDRRVVRLWRMRLLATTLLVAAGATLVAARAAEPLTAAFVGLAAAAAGAIAAAIVPQARYSAWGFRIRNRDLLVRRGVLWRTVSVVPHARIQHVDTRRGPVERWLGLSRVVVYTAGSTGGSLTVPGLPVEEAEALRDRLAALGGGDDAV